MVVIRFVMNVKMDMGVDEVVEGTKNSIEMFREATGSKIKTRILTDLSGPFNTIVQEFEFESLAEYERYRTELFNNPKFRDMQADRPVPFESGRAEFYTLEAAYE